MDSSKIVIDTNVYISAIGFDNIVYQVLYKIIENPNYIIYLSKEIYNEISDILFRPSFDKKTHNKLTLEAKKDFLLSMKNIAKFSNPTTKITICRDPKDNKFLELAKEIKADYLITGDNDLLEIKQFEITQICKPSQFFSDNLNLN